MKNLTLVIALAVVLAPVQVLALSCMANTVERTYDRAQNDRSGRYILVFGKLEFDTALLPNTSAPEAQIPGVLEGYKLLPSGGDAEMRLPLVLDVACQGGHCPVYENGQNVLAFVKQTSVGFIITGRLCDGYLLFNPTAQMIAEARRCLTNAGCAPLR